jgi:hypothetical protein
MVYEPKREAILAFNSSPRRSFAMITPFASKI